MNSYQYEEFCRFFLAEKLGIDIERIKSVDIPNPTRPGLLQYKHKNDLYWETETELSVYLHIANAKWRGSSKVKQPDVLLLQQVKQKLAAHKALMLTSQGYTTGAIAAAKDEGIALHIVKPSLIITELPTRGRSAIRARLQEIATTSNQPLFIHEVVHRAFDFSELSFHDPSPIAPARTYGYQTRVVSAYETRVGTGQTRATTSSNKGQVSGETRGGGPITKGGGPIERG